jgi:aminoglycoside phosphotransferase (APT) family kinase protein
MTETEIGAWSGGDIPARLDELTPEFLTQVIGANHPGTVVEDFEVLNVSRYGNSMVSTSDRAVLELTYSKSKPGLPARVVLKMRRGDDTALDALYETEVNFYRYLRPQLDIEAPRSLGSVYDAGTSQFYLLLEDLSLRAARFPNVTQSVTRDEVRAILETLARLHAKFWNSIRFQGDLSGYQSHVSGRLFRHFEKRHPHIVERELTIDAFKADLLRSLQTTPAELWALTRAVQKHQATLPQTIVHGDAHIGNTYLLPNGTGGLIDWQLTVRGSWIHDVGYLIVTALPIDEARAHEQSLLANYLGKLAEFGVAAPPSFADAWVEYRRAVVWGLQVGWLGTPKVNYGAEINRINHERMAAAYVDLAVARAAKDVA